MAQQQVPRFVTVAEVANVMRVSKMTVYRMIHAGDIPAVRVGKSFRVPQQAVQQIMSQGIGAWEETNSSEVASG